MSGLFRTGDIDENFLKFLCGQESSGNDSRNFILVAQLPDKRSMVCFALSRSFLADFKKQPNRYSGPILEYVMDIQGAARLDFVMS